MTYGYALLLDSGAQWPCRAKTLEEARAVLAKHNNRHRTDKEAGELVTVRLATGLIKPKPKRRKRKA